ncbi:hypothetical protein ACFQS1_11875 [Paractinoplanes rhizophilus]|uniref:Uncharacterized protein n=1 Tax=Paractinoplanes rhizophilus TaxID=1416877 RepID=A0ABW2HNG0_9ACTN
MSDVQPADFETADYRSVLRRLTTLDEEAADLRAEAQRWHDDRVAAADRAVGEADDNLAATAEAVSRTQRELEQIDARALQLWADYVHKVGPRAERYGRTMPPAAIPRQRGDRDAADYLEEVAAKVQYIAPPQPINFGVKALFVLFGLAGGLVGAGAFLGLRGLGGTEQTGTWRDAMPVVALVVLLACPVLAVVAAKKVADRRSAGLDPATVATVLVTGLVSAGLIIAAVGL